MWSYHVRATVHLLTWCALSCLSVSVGCLYLLNDTPFQRWVNHVTPRSDSGEHEQLAAVVTDPQLLFFVLVLAGVALLLVAAGGLRRASR